MALKHHADRLKAASLQDLSKARTDRPALDAPGWSVDLTRHYLDADTEAELAETAARKDLAGAIERLFDAAIVNPSEGRAALHWALRAPAPTHESTKAVRQTALDAEVLAEQIARGEKTSSAGKPFKAIVHIGIGGSDFGPRLIADAFHDKRHAGMELRYCANLDPLDLSLAVDGLDPAETLVVGVSKSFGTEETLYNLGRARTWLKASVGDGWAQHFVLVTANPPRAKAWLDGADGLILDLPETIGGRYSIWSAGSVACSIALKSDVMADFRQGAADMDAHVASAPLGENLAVRLALLDYWNSSFMGFGARALLAYSRRLRLLPAYLQQLEMESNGKSVGPDGEAVDLATTPLLWGGEGTIGQHSYHQWLHQSPTVMPAEFILAPGSREDTEGVTGLTAHALAQAEVLANGRTLDEVRAEEPELPMEIAAQKVHAGGRPSTLFQAPVLDAYRLGSLIALFEHRTYLAGVLWGVNSFDQWGVERGKTMAGRLKPALDGETTADDPVTAKLIAGIRTAH
ncbi:glucose-6-phosphate isomerase [Henriciella aquimarina]|uniref:glucose-6-phosphate isomerase n=1 Tax=Henriciella aquimarina TaxID=545261 RepID=UPI000A00CB9E|nr:glucose-6-phosphate isomerase [Henriciella aquimarina]